MDTLIAMALIAVAVWYVFTKVKWFGNRRQKTLCGSCSGCCSGVEPFSCGKREDGN